jgi:hypothetical protein
MGVDTLPICRYPPCDLPEKVRGEVRDTHPGEDEEAGVDGDLMEIGDALLSCPSQVSIP